MKYVDKMFLKTQGDNWQQSLCDAIKANDMVKIVPLIFTNKINLHELVPFEGKKRNYLHVAAMYGRKYIIEYLLLAGCKIDILDSDSCKPLDVAMILNNLEAVEYLVKKLDEMDK
jgi:ankyrin repeat protein